jgi:hypothetical protein
MALNARKQERSIAYRNKGAVDVGIHVAELYQDILKNALRSAQRSGEAAINTLTIVLSRDISLFNEQEVLVAEALNSKARY